MRSLILILFLLCLSAADAVAEFVDGANAVQMIGQSDWSSTPNYTKAGTYNSPNPFGFTNPRGVAVDTAGRRLFVTDSGNNRVLVFNLNADGTPVDLRADFVLGQPDFGSQDQATSSTELSTPGELLFDSVGQRLFVSDDNNNRIMVFDVTTIANGEPAVNVLGQPDFVSGLSSLSASAFFGPRGMAYDSAGSRLFVADGGQSRILVFDVSTITNGEPAVNVLGQDDFVTSVPSGTNAGSIGGPGAIIYDGANQRLFVTDASAGRVLVFDVAAITDGEDAVNVLGVGDLTTPGGGLSQSELAGPVGLAYDSAAQRLYVSELTNNRITVFDVNAVVDGENAINVVGQSNFTSDSIATTQSGLNQPRQIAIDASNGIVYVADVTNSRIMIFDVTSISNGENAVGVLGQTDTLEPPTSLYTNAGANNSPNAWGFDGALGVAVDEVGHRLFVSELDGCRILVFNLNTENELIDLIADNVLGQSGFRSNTCSTTRSGLNMPAGLAFDPDQQRLFVTDAGNARVLVFDVSSVTNGEDAINVLGQPDFVTSAANLTAAGMEGPISLALDSDNQRLFVGDSTLDRITVFDVATITNGESAIAVLGKPDFTTNTGAASQTVTGEILGMAFDEVENLLFASDGANNRVLVFDVETVTNGEAAIRVFGQSDFTSTNAGLSRTALNKPGAIALDTLSRRMFVTDVLNSRLLSFDIKAIDNGEEAQHVLGQPDFTTNAAIVAQNRLVGAFGLAFSPTAQQLYVTDSVDRVMIFDASEPNVIEVTSATANGAYSTGSSISIQIEFALSVTVTGTPTLTLETGTTDRVAQYVSGSGTNTLTFTYTVQAGDTSADLDYTGATALSLAGGTIKDSGNNDAALTLPTPGANGSLSANKAIVIDTSLPSSPTVSSPGGSSSDRTPTLSGTAEAGSTVRIFVDGVLVGTTTADSFGNWTFELTTELGYGSHTITATVTDSAGNTSSTSTELDLVVTTGLSGNTLDLDGDLLTDVVFFKALASGVDFSYRQSLGSSGSRTLGGVGAKAVAADYSGAGKAELATVERSGDGTLLWTVYTSAGSTTTGAFGQSGDYVLYGCNFDGGSGQDQALLRGTTLLYKNFGDNSASTASLPAKTNRKQVIGCGDVNGDGVDELLVKKTTLVKSVRVPTLYAYSLAGVQLFKKSFTSVEQVFAANVSGTATNEIAVQSKLPNKSRLISFFDSTTKKRKAKLKLANNLPYSVGTCAAGNATTDCMIRLKTKKLVQRTILSTRANSDAGATVKGYKLQRSMGIHKF